MKVYILIEQVYRIDTDNGAEIIGVYKDKTEAEKKQDKLIKYNVENWDFIEDKQENKNCKILFYLEDENWDNYIEYRIIESEVL